MRHRHTLPRLTTLLLYLTFTLESFGQTATFPHFLVGDWKVENKESYEHWDKLNEKLLRGFSYTKQNEFPKVLEYMELQHQGDTIIYKVNIPGQHEGQTFTFIQRVAGKQWIYENPTNDFPKTIIYEQLETDAIQIYLKNEEQEISYKLIRQQP